MGSTKINLTEEQFTEVTLSALKEHPEGITEYPILDFDDRAPVSYTHLDVYKRQALCSVS